MTATTDDILHSLAEPLAAAAAVDLGDAEAARAELQKRFPFEGEAARALGASLVQAVHDGVICDKGHDPVRYSRLAKPDAATHDFSIDFVWMEGPGIHHRHPKGEINLCYAVDGDPRFDGLPEGWVTFAPDTTHVPTVSGGRMLIVYFLPEGAVEWIQGG